MDPFVTLLSWLTKRVPIDGFLFCDVVQTSEICKINPAVPNELVKVY